MAQRILLINGPNLNLLGTREPQIYGSATLADVVAQAQAQAQQLSVRVDVFQSNHEGAIVDRIHAAAGFVGTTATTTSLAGGDDDEGKIKEEEAAADAVVINPGALTHTSVAIRDALLGTGLPFVEVHVSNVHARETWRGRSYLSDKAEAVICGMGVFGYTAAIEFAARHMKSKEGGPSRL
ncbi:3-dehydroquinate dehydratase [Purpureocillium takamizusanense]|uniref:Catabolic 3-dehydroquinase n=1 Tax=Purpureocillium takamizusanense TaxID=2060973 RepID=A0A9Q8QD93_9HYPO|nr:3-dehydroquinate dehydratase [Purpureocillium takamizusanense]UNI17142.1 3-dehydroquinate dehydratase [Purpureocillium takamizusanense]